MLHSVSAISPGGIGLLLVWTLGGNEKIDLHHGSFFIAFFSAIGGILKTSFGIDLSRRGFVVGDL